jgi:hypothetical protein
VVAAEVGHLKHDLLPVGRGDDPFGEAPAHLGEDVGQVVRLISAIGVKAGLVERRLDGCGCMFYAVLIVGEQVDVLGGTADHAVGQQCVATSEREPMPARHTQRDDRDLAVQVGDGHQAAAAVCSTGWCSSHACRTPAGR